MPPVQTTGLEEMKRGINQLSVDMTNRLRAVAWHSSRTIYAKAKELLASKTHGTGRTAAAIHIVENLAAKRFDIISEAPSGKPANLPIWIERGTEFQMPRAYMRPALDAENENYKREMEKAAIDAVKSALGD